MDIKLPPLVLKSNVAGFSLAAQRAGKFGYVFVVFSSTHATNPFYFSGGGAGTSSSQSGMLL